MKVKDFALDRAGVKNMQAKISTGHFPVDT